MKKALLIGILLGLGCPYLGFVDLQADDPSWPGVIHGAISYYHPFQWDKYDYAEILYADYTPTGFSERIAGADYTYWIPNDLGSGQYHLRTYAYDCEREWISAAFYYEYGTVHEKNGWACMPDNSDR